MAQLDSVAVLALIERAAAGRLRLGGAWLVDRCGPSQATTGHRNDQAERRLRRNAALARAAVLIEKGGSWLAKCGTLAAPLRRFEASAS